jgi:acetoin utilization deacetylase AcuC-like enzyme
MHRPIAKANGRRLWLQQAASPLLTMALAQAGAAPARAACAGAAPQTGWADDACFDTPAFEPGHPEQPDRVAAIRQRVRADAALQQRLQPLAPLRGEVVTQALARVHTPAHVQAIAARYGPAIDGLARCGVGAALAAVQAVGGGPLANAFVASRPPGHHASNTGREEGFCFFNNVAVAARHVQQVLGHRRVLIVDWDYHHGDGTEALFYEDDSVLYFSTFDPQAYPRTPDAAQRTGRGAGLGTTINQPLPRGATDADVMAVYAQHLAPAAERFKPDFVLVSAGFDSREGDRLGRFAFSDEGFAAMTHFVAALAARHAGGRLVSVLEGGYNPSGAARAAQAHLRALADAARAR